SHTSRRRGGQCLQPSVLTAQPNSTTRKPIFVTSISANRYLLLATNSTATNSPPTQASRRAIGFLSLLRGSQYLPPHAQIDTYTTMRLLYTTSDGGLGLTKDIIRKDEIPPYAILSHTWGEQEVVFDDLKSLDSKIDINAMRGSGWEKIRFCAQQAKRDRLEYFWVDTCCINRESSTEISEAINSMFLWYQKAAKCYVLLSDVENISLEGNKEASRRWKAAFRTSRWFKRGWTLQELLAPHSVEFFSKEGSRLGDKESQKHTIQEVTGIPIKALSGSDLCEFDVAERLSWAENRQTTREEDGAYCLLGIFGIHLSLIYGEGKENALNRLMSKISRNAETGRSQGQEERLSKMASWLSAPDPSTNYHKAHKQRQAETGLWLLESANFVEWKESAASPLWLYGIPGCGKSILSSTIIEHLLQHCHDDMSMVTAYFYFDFNDIQKQDPELMLRSLLCQLLQRSITIPKGVDALFSSSGNGLRLPSVSALIDVTRQTMQEFTQVYVVLDALDESTQRSELMGVLETIAGWQLDNLHLLMTSRKVRDIQVSLETYVKQEHAVCLQRDVVDQDIQRYVQQRLRDDKDLAKWNKDGAVRQEIETALMRGARGMFRWAVCQLDTLAKCRNRAMLRKSLATLPQTLDQTYDRILSAIGEDDCKFAMRILQWLTFSARPLSVEEMAEIVAIDVARDPAFDRDEVLEDPLEVLNICSSLVTVTRNEANGDSRPGQQSIALAHYSVQEYLVSERIRQGSAKQYSMQEVKCHNAITKSCLKYLIQLKDLSKETLERSALARYSAEFWSSHLQKTGDEMEQSSRLAMNLLAIDEPAYLNWIRLYNPDYPSEKPNLKRSLDMLPTPLYYAAKLGLSTIATLLLDRGAEVNVQGGFWGNALQAASYQGHEQIVKMLLDRDAEFNAQGGNWGNALQAASYQGHEQIVKMLLDQGAEVNAQGGYYGNALQTASLQGHEQVVKMLLNQGADVNAQGGFWGNALQAASYQGHEQVVKMLLNQGADVNAQGGFWGNALQAASYQGHEQTVKMLLDQGAEVNAQGGYYGNALQVASLQGHEQVVKMLLDQGAEVNAQGGYYGNALQTASLQGHEQVVKMLLNQGADVNAQGGDYGNAMQAAAYEGHEETFRILIFSSSFLEPHDPYGRTLLWWAAAVGNPATVEALINQQRIDPQLADRFGRKPSWIAMKKGHVAVCKLLGVSDEEIDTERNASPKVSDKFEDRAHYECDVCTIRFPLHVRHYYCSICNGKRWFVCEDCKRRGATCRMGHALVEAER
ncbi:hypothetical protein J1614_004092, partial [Plenodomus biglobosus]